MPEQELNRRRFTHGLAASVSFGLMAPAAPAADPQPQGEAPAAPRPEPEPPVKRPLEPEDFLLASLLQQYPSDHLTDEAIAGIRAGLRRNLELGRRLRATGLENGDEPAFVFRAYRGA